MCLPRYGHSSISSLLRLERRYVAAASPTEASFTMPHQSSVATQVSAVQCKVSGSMLLKRLLALLGSGVGVFIAMVGVFEPGLA